MFGKLVIEILVFFKTESEILIDNGSLFYHLGVNTERSLDA